MSKRKERKRRVRSVRTDNKGREGATVQRNRAAENREAARRAGEAS